MARFLRIVVGFSFAIVPILVYLFDTGFLERDLILPLIPLLLSAALLLYFLRRHEFTGTSEHRIKILGSLALIFGSSMIWFVLHLFADSLKFSPSTRQPIPTVPESFLPEWWLLIFLVPATISLVVVSIRETEDVEYSTPNNLETLPQAPVFFGLASGFIGFWGVLFVGLGVIHRIVIVAPIFEELLKFGVALLFATAIFGRSLVARYAVAIIIGVTFGLVEHTITYPGEVDLIYLFRVIFHSVTAGLSVSVFTVFEEYGDNRLMWVAPALPTFFHFSHNTFTVVSAVILFGSGEATLSTVQLVFGVLVIIATVTATILALRRNELIFEFHRALSSFLPDHEV